MTQDPQAASAAAAVPAAALSAAPAGPAALPGPAAPAPAAVPAVYDPPVDPDAVAALGAALRAVGVPVEAGRPLGPLTTFGIGGPAALFAAPATEAELGLVLAALAATEPASVPLLVVGKGSNMLVSDAGFPGLVLKLGAGFKWLRRDDAQVTAGGGEAMPAVAAWVAQQGLSGLEFAAGIPATVGGSVRMNAGAHGGDTASRLLAALVWTAGEPGARWRPAAELRFGYRTSHLPPRSVVLAARWALSPADPVAIRERLDELRAWRRRTQPLRERNCGSVFTNPDGDSAGRLIDAAGLKGWRVGGARVSDKHANFIVVGRGTPAADVFAVVHGVRRRVLAAGGPVLHPEVRLVGAFAEPTAELGPPED